MTQSPFNPNARKCGCLGAGWFDASVTEDDDWTRCPFHHKDGVPDPRVDPEGHKALCDRLYDELHKENDERHSVNVATHQ